MPFALLADEFHSDPKTIKAGLAGAGLYARALSYCGHYVTDGFVPLAWASEVAAASVRRKVTDAGFWVEVVGGETYHYVSGDETYVVTITEKGFFIPDYLAYNPTRKAVMAKRSELSEKRSEAGKKGAAARWKRTPDSSKEPVRTPADLSIGDEEARERTSTGNGSTEPPGNGNGHGKTMASGMATVWQADGPLPLPLKDPKAVTSQETSFARAPAGQPQVSDFKIPTPTLREMPAA